MLGLLVIIVIRKLTHLSRDKTLTCQTALQKDHEKKTLASGSLNEPQCYPNTLPRGTPDAHAPCDLTDRASEVKTSVSMAFASQ